MFIQVIQVEHSLVIFIKGRILLRECRELKDSVLSRLNPTVKVLYIDLKEVDFIDSAGLGVMVGIKMSANKYGAPTYLIGPKPEIKSLFTVAKLDSIFKIVNSESELPDPDILKKAKQKLENETATIESKKHGTSAQKTTIPVNMNEEDSSVGLFASKNKNSTTDEKKQKVLNLCKEALTLFNKGDIKSAIEKFKEALRIDPTYLPARNNLALLYEKSPKWYKNALEQWETVLTLSKELNEPKYEQRALKRMKILKKKLFS